MFKHDNPSTNTNAFDIDKALNQNLDKIDTAFGQDRTRITALEGDNTTNKQDISNIKQEQISQDDYIEELQAENERLRNDLNTLPSKSASGEVISLDKVSDARFKKFVIGGNSGQETREGYNLIDIASNIITSSNRGLTASVDEEGYVIVNGTAEGAYVNLLSPRIDLTDVLENGETYTLWQENEVATAYTGVYIQVIAAKSDGSGYVYYSTTTGAKNYLTFKVDKSIYNSYLIAVQTGKTTETFSNYKNRFMLVKGSYNSNTIPAYELYGVMPSPDFPSEVKTVKGNANVVVCNKNLYDATTPQTTKNGITTSADINTIKINGTISSNDKSVYNHLILPSGTYTFSIQLISGSIVSTETTGELSSLWYIYKTDTWTRMNQGALIISSSQKTGSFTFTLEEETDIQVGTYLRIRETYTNAVLKYQIEKGSISTTIVANQNQSFTIPVQDEMGKIEDYADTFMKENDKFYEKHIIRKFILTNNNNWKKDTLTNGITRYYCATYSQSMITPANNDTAAIAMCNLGIISATDTSKGKSGVAIHPNGSLYISEDIYNNIENTNVVIYVVLKEPKSIECTEEQKAILDEIEKTAHSYQGKTHIYSIDELSPIFDVEAFIDLNEVIGG